jgi:ABC-type multidrug transport system fused ATPase/permease subunit
VFASIACFLLLIPLQKILANRFVSLDHALMSARDVRVNAISQTLRGIRVVKFFGWRKSIFSELNSHREKELGWRRRLVWAEGLSAFVFLFSSALVTVVTFYVHLQWGGTLDAAVAFACLSLFMALEEPLSELSFVIANVVAARVSASRVQLFLTEPSVDSRKESSVRVTRHENFGDAPAVVVSNLSVSFASKPSPALQHIELNIASGEAVALVGEVGSGKTALLQALLGEQPPSHGAVHIQAGCSGLRMGYVPQEAFVLNATLRENILLGEPLSRLSEVLEVTALTRDVAAFPAGVETEIGEQGVNLSGGQKQRLSLARAAALNPNLVLLDDPLSAVDEATEKHLCDSLLFGRWAKATRLVVTHRLSSLPRFDTVVFLKQGRMVASGSHAQLMATCREYAVFVGKAEALKPKNATQSGEAQGGNVCIHAANPKEEHAQRATNDEALERGAVSKGTFARYFHALGGGDSGVPLRLSFLLILTFMAFCVPFLQRAWLSAWTESTPQGFFLTEFLGTFLVSGASKERNLVVFATLGVLGFVAVFAERVAWLQRGLEGGRVIHAAALSGVLHAPLAFFDGNPQGRILNRFSRDMDGVDRHLPWAVSNTTRALANVGATLLVVLTLFPVLLFAVVPAALLFFHIQATYRASAREIKRMDARARSPVFSLFKETLTGLAEVRAHGKQTLFHHMFTTRLAEAVRVSFNHVSVNRWFAVRIPLVSASVSFGLTLLLAWAAWKGHVGSGLAGLVITYSTALWASLSWGVRSFAEMESRMTGVERLFEYGGLVREHDTTQLPALSNETPWPTFGRVTFDAVSARYGENRPLILNNISLDIPGGAKVGFLGRTGAGKSTLFQTLFRFLETAGGEIRVDGVPLASIPLDRLRQALAIIPQDPVLFSGSLRGNLDRFGKHNDAELWKALAAAHLESIVRTLPGGLDFVLDENGANLSQGQRQMVCLARALLCGAKVILLDEATASVDVRTDDLMQDTLRNHCQNATVLVIAHRVDTLADCDMLVELAEGRVVNVENKCRNDRRPVFFEQRASV